MQVSEKYYQQKGAGKYLMEKIMKGGSGVWGDVAMSAHPDINQADLRQITNYILSLSNKEAVKKSLPASGSIRPAADTKKQAVLVLSASYSSKGANNVKALSDRKTIFRLSGYRPFTGKENNSGFHLVNKNNINYLQTNSPAAWFSVDSLDLTGISSVTISGEWEKKTASGYHVEIRLDSASGKLLGKGVLKSVSGALLDPELRCKIESVSDGKFHSLYFIGDFENGETVSPINLKNLEFK